MTTENVTMVRTAYEAYARGDLPALLSVVDPDLEWTYLDPNIPHPEPQVCHGRVELERALGGLAEHRFRAELEEVAGVGDRVMVCVRIPGLDAQRGRAGDDRSYVVLTIRDGRIVQLRDCRDREEARSLAGLG
jgi:uncharacterized protein